jgi:hypothetical protein
LAIIVLIVISLYAVKKERSVDSPTDIEKFKETGVISVSDQSKDIDENSTVIQK